LRALKLTLPNNLDDAQLGRKRRALTDKNVGQIYGPWRTGLKDQG
jgi:hypothetical protein